MTTRYSTRLLLERKIESEPETFMALVVIAALNGSPHPISARDAGRQ